jgi:hypothetical protein
MTGICIVEIAGAIEVVTTNVKRAIWEMGARWDCYLGGFWVFYRHAFYQWVYGPGFTPGIAWFFRGGALLNAPGR